MLTTRSCWIAAAFGLAAGAAHAQTANVTMYGRIDLSYDYTRGPTPSTQALTDNTSRWGIRGTESLGSSLTAVFGMEYGINADAGGATTPNFRHTYVGLRSGIGTIAMGRLDSGSAVGSPVYSLDTRIIDFVIHDAGAVAIGTKVLNARNRVSNAIGYASPAMGGFTVRARVNLAGPDPATPAANSPVKFEDDFRQYDLGVAYELKGFRAGVGYSRDTKNGGLVLDDFKYKAQVIAGYDAEAWKVYGVYGRDHFRNAAASREQVPYWLIGGSVRLGQGRLIGNYMERAVQKDRNGTLKKAQIGYGYQLSKRTQPYVYFDHERANSNSSAPAVKVFGVGLMHNF